MKPIKAPWNKKKCQFSLSGESLTEAFIIGTYNIGGDTFVKVRFDDGSTYLYNLGYIECLRIKTDLKLIDNTKQNCIIPIKRSL